MLMQTGHQTMQMLGGDGMLTTQEVADFLRVDTRTLRTLPLAPVRVGRQLRYFKHDLERMLEKSQITEPKT